MPAAILQCQKKSVKYETQILRKGREQKKGHLNYTREISFLISIGTITIKVTLLLKFALLGSKVRKKHCSLVRRLLTSI